MAKSWSAKGPSETYPVGIDFGPVLAACIPQGQTLASATCTITVYSGNDANPTAVLSGSPSILGTVAYQTVMGGLAGTAYQLLFTGTSSAGLVMQGAAVLPVQTIYP